jgi:hypothetical protein
MRIWRLPRLGRHEWAALTLVAGNVAAWYVFWRWGDGVLSLAILALVLGLAGVVFVLSSIWQKRVIRRRSAGPGVLPPRAEQGSDSLPPPR